MVTYRVHVSNKSLNRIRSGGLRAAVDFPPTNIYHCDHPGKGDPINLIIDYRYILNIYKCRAST